MPIEFRCSNCQKTLRVGDEAVGKKARCPQCGTIQDVISSISNFATVPSPTPTGPAPAPQFDNPFRSSTLGNPFSDAQPASASGQSTNPYAAPTQPSGYASPYTGLTYAQRRLFAENKVKGPALAMMVLQIIAIVLQLFQLAAVLANNNFEPGQIIPFATALGLSSLILFGAWQMYRLRSYGMSIVAALLSIIPCSGCCIISMPVGIWALVVLSDANVKSAFD
jgi:phage FluMu protein Com